MEHDTAPRSRTHRSRWAAIGAAIAVSLGAGGLRLAEASSGSSSTYVAITPCRVVDTRSGIGPLASPLGPGATATFPVTGDQGQCVGIPAGATGVNANLTVTDPSALTYLTMWPTGAAQPNASSINVVGGQAPTANSVTTALGAGGSVDVFNHDGSVNVIIDVTGYYLPAGVAPAPAPAPAPIDAYTKAEVDAKLTPTEETVSVTIGGASIRSVGATPLVYETDGDITFPTAGASKGMVDLPMPVGARLTAITVGYIDGSSAAIAVGIQSVAPNNNGYIGIGTSTFGTGTVSATFPALPPVAPPRRYVLELDAPAHSLALQVTYVTYSYAVLD